MRASKLEARICQNIYFHFPPNFKKSTKKTFLNLQTIFSGFQDDRREKKNHCDI